MTAYRFFHPAEEEMTEASLFYEAASAGLGNDFLDDVKRVIDGLREHPQLGHAVGRGLRRMLLHRFPFSIVYSDNGVLNIAITEWLTTCLRLDVVGNNLQ